MINRLISYINMDNIKEVPTTITEIIPIFHGDVRQLHILKVQCGRFIQRGSPTD